VGNLPWKKGESFWNLRPVRGLSRLRIFPEWDQFLSVLDSSIGIIEQTTTKSIDIVEIIVK
jgi:hypothetical protein